MEHFGSHYAVLLHDPLLRGIASPTPEPSGVSDGRPAAGERLRLCAARALHALANCVAPSLTPAANAVDPVSAR